jgi:AcrR family transcriptional regulator
MKHESIDAKERILDTMVKLLLERKNVNKITTREIAKLANVNSALINYYYQSKDNLVFKAVEICMENMAKKLLDRDMQNEDHVSRLKNMIKEISNFAFNNYYLSEIAISTDIKNGSINTSQMILPLLKEIFKENKTQSELKLMALQIITPMQVMFLNANDYKGYLLVDIFNEELRNELLDKMVDNILKGGN